MSDLTAIACIAAAATLGTLLGAAASLLCTHAPAALRRVAAACMRTRRRKW